MNLLNEIIETERLLLVPADLRYANDIFAHFDANTTRYMTPKPAETIDETLSFLTESISGMREGTNFQLIITTKEDNAFIGCVGLHDLSGETPELGIWIKASSFGHKYGQEAVRGLVHWAKKQGKWKKAKYPVDKRNASSRKIPESLHGVIVNEYTRVNQSGFELDEVEYEVSLETEFVIKEASPAEIDEYLKICVDRVKRLRENGKALWDEDQFTLKYLTENYANPAFFVCSIDNEVIGGFILVEQDDYWRDSRGDKAFYFHKFVIGNGNGSKGYSARILDWLKTYSKLMGKEFIRLDYDETREYVRLMYESSGFIAIGETKDKAGKRLIKAEYKL